MTLVPLRGPAPRILDGATTPPPGGITYDASCPACAQTCEWWSWPAASGSHAEPRCGCGR